MVGTLAHSTIRRFVMQSSMQLMGCDMETTAYRKKKVQEMLDYLKEIGLSVYIMQSRFDKAVGALMGELDG